MFLRNLNVLITHPIDGDVLKSKTGREYTRQTMIATLLYTDVPNPDGRGGVDVEKALRTDALAIRLIQFVEDQSQPPFEISLDELSLIRERIKGAVSTMSVGTYIYTLLHKYLEESVEAGKEEKGN